MPEIIYAAANYTGGGIYIYCGKLSDGTYFRAGDCEDFIEICNADTSTEDADYLIFYEKHRVRTLTGDEYVKFFNKMIQHIISFSKKGNYCVAELEKRMIKEEIMKTMKYVKTLSEKEVEKISKASALGRELRTALDIPMNKPMCVGDTMVRIGAPSKKNDVFMVERPTGRHFYVVIEPMDEMSAFCYSIYPR